MKNTLTLFLLAFLFSISQLNAQTAGRSVVGSTGNTLQNTECQINYTMGEIFVTTANADTSTVTQGFHQGILDYNTSIVAVDKPVVISIYPNPADDFFKINFKANTMGYKAEIYDIAGRLVMLKEVQSHENLVTINTSELSNGMYVVHLIANDNSFVHSERISVVD